MDPVCNKTQIADLIYDVKIASKIDEIADNFTFDFEVDVASPDPIKFSMLEIKVYDIDGNELVDAVTTIEADYSIIKNYDGGARGRTNIPISIDFSKTSIDSLNQGGPYKIQTKILVQDADNKRDPYTTSLVFEVENNTTNNMNKRYRATEILDNVAQIVLPKIDKYGERKLTNTKYLHASFINAENGIATHDNSVVGFLNFSSEKNDTYFTIDQLTSQHLGVYARGVIQYEEEKFGFSSYFGINNLLIDDGKLEKAAYNLAVREDILNSPSNISIYHLAKADAVLEEVSLGSKRATSNIRFENNPTDGDVIVINDVSFIFKEVATEDDEILIGATLLETITNATEVLSAFNPTTQNKVDKAIYEINGSDGILIEYKEPGIDGNIFSIATKLVGTKASISGGQFSYNISSSLSGGENSTVLVNKFHSAYDLRADQVYIGQMINIFQNQYNFKAAGNIGVINATIISYSAKVIGSRTEMASIAQNKYDTSETLFNNYLERLKESKEVDIDEEVANSMILQTAYAANAEIIKVINRMYDTLLAILR